MLTQYRSKLFTALVCVATCSMAGLAQQPERRVIRRGGSEQSPPPSSGIRHSERRTITRSEPSRDRVVRRDLPTRRVVSYGTRITRLPVSARTVRVHNRDYYVWDDTYYVAFGSGPSLTYVVSRPPIGVRVRYLPESYEVVEVTGRRYYVFDDVYYEPTTVGFDTYYTVVEPPLGGEIMRLPDDYAAVTIDGERLYAIGDEYYRAVIRNGVVVYIRVPAPRRTYDHISGVVVYRERMALPDDSEVEVRLLDISRPGQEPETVAMQRIRRPYQPPIPFRLRFATNDIDPRRRYALQASILIDDDLAWVNDSLVPVLGSERPRDVEILVERVRDSDQDRWRRRHIDRDWDRDHDRDSDRD
ncbi:MAG: YbaY family lipoprotein [Phycisphaerales bacterium]|nr:YbaY family lipoprotein [Phycisphaerales bacterium]